MAAKVKRQDGKPKIESKDSIHFPSAALTAEEKFDLLQSKVREVQVEKAWKLFEDAGFEPILIKGWAIARLYPEPHKRGFCDVDLMISPDLFEEACRIAEGLKEDLLPVDLHRGARHLDKLKYKELFAASQMIRCNSTKIRVLRHEDHLRILCAHWLNDGGTDREKLWDVYYAVERRPKDFDWVRLLEAGGERRRLWTVCAIGLAQKYLGLNLEGTPLEKAGQSVPKWVTKALEKEWASETRLLPLHYFLINRKMLWKQIKKRLPPNPIQATVEMDGDFDEKSRLPYQIRDILFRLKPSLRRLLGAIRTLKSEDAFAQGAKKR